MTILDKYLIETEEFLGDLREVGETLGDLLDLTAVGVEFLDMLKEVLRTIIRFVIDVLEFLITTTESIVHTLSGISDALTRARVLYRFASLVSKQMVLAGSAVERLSNVVNLGLPAFGLHNFRDGLSKVDNYLAEWFTDTPQLLQTKLANFRSSVTDIRDQLKAIV